MGNSLMSGLQKCLVNVVDLRRNCKESHASSEQQIGNTIGTVVVQPPDTHCIVGEAHSEAETSPGQTRQQHINQPHGCIWAAEGVLSHLEAAACAVRKSIQRFRADPQNLQGQLAKPHVHVWEWKKALSNPGFEAIRDCALFVSSWRNLSAAKVDFGGGKAKFMLGDEMPVQLRFTPIVEGPDGNGVFCKLRFPMDGFDKLQSSGLLDVIAPEASFVQPLA